MSQAEDGDTQPQRYQHETANDTQAHKINRETDIHALSTYSKSVCLSAVIAMSVSCRRDR